MCLKYTNTNKNKKIIVNFELKKVLIFIFDV